MAEADLLHELLVADLALHLKPADARRVALVLERYWSGREEIERRFGDELFAAAEITATDLEHLMRERAAGEAADSTPPTARYRDFELLGTGGMGEVYRAYDPHLDRTVAVKVLRDRGGDPRRLRERFLREARLTSLLEHPGVVAVHDFGELPDGRPFYAMRCVAGGRTLADAIDAAAEPSDRRALLDPFLRACDAVHFAHSLGILHRDLKPANIALGDYGEVLVLDWGLAHETDDAADRARSIGTRGFAPPEATLGDGSAVSSRSDVYGLGATLYAILAGGQPPPWPASPPPEAPAGLVPILTRALAVDPADRYRDAGEFAADVRRWLADEEVERQVELLLARAEGADADEQTALARRILELRPADPRGAALRAVAERRREAEIADLERRTRGRALRRAGLAALVLFAATAAGGVALIESRRAESARAWGEAEGLAGFMLYDLHRGLSAAGRLDLLAPVARRALQYYEGRPAGSDGPSIDRRAAALRNLGAVLWEEGDLDAAERAYGECRALLELSDASADPERRESLARLLIDLADVQVVTGRTREVREILAAAREIAQAPPADWSNEVVAQIDVREGAILDRAGDAAGLPMVLDAATRLDDESRKRPDDASLLRSAGRAARRCGALLLERGRAADAVTWFSRELDGMRRLAMEAPENALAKVALAEALARTADVASGHGRHAEARLMLDEALAVRRWLVGADPSNVTWHAPLASLLLTSGDARLRAVGDPAPAGVAAQAALEHEEGLAIARRLFELQPRNAPIAEVVAALLERQGMDAANRNDLDAAERRFREALAIRERRRDEENGPTTRGDVAEMQCRLADLSFRRGDLATARKLFEETLVELEDLLRLDPERARWRSRAAHVARRVADLVARDESQVALALYRKAAGWLGELRERDVDRIEWREARASIHDRMGNLLLKEGRPEAAFLELGKAIDLFAELVEIEPAAAARRGRLAHSQALYANALAREGRVEEAYGKYVEARDEHARAANVLPDEREKHRWYEEQVHRYGLYAGRVAPANPLDHWILASEHRARGRLREATEAYRKALESKEIREDLERPTLYYAAEVAARAVAEAESAAEAAEFRRLAIHWLAEDLELRRRRADADGGVEARKLLAEHLEWVSKGAMEFEPLRADPEFARRIR